MMHFLKLFVFGLALMGSSGVMAQQANTQPVNNEQTPPVIKAKTDEQIEYEQDYIPANWREMSQKEREEFAKKILEDRFILTTMNFKVITSGQTKICTLNVILNNNSPNTQIIPPIINAKIVLITKNCCNRVLKNPTSKLIY